MNGHKFFSHSSSPKILILFFNSLLLEVYIQSNISNLYKIIFCLRSLYCLQKIEMQSFLLMILLNFQSHAMLMKLSAFSIGLVFFPQAKEEKKIEGYQDEWWDCGWILPNISKWLFHYYIIIVIVVHEHILLHMQYKSIG